MWIRSERTPLDRRGIFRTLGPSLGFFTPAPAGNVQDVVFVSFCCPKVGGKKQTSSWSAGPSGAAAGPLPLNANESR